MTVAASNYDRIQNEKYFTPAWVTEALISAERFGKVWDPAGGDGAIVAALPSTMTVWASDIEPDSDFVQRLDFFECQDANGYDIVSNPPYGIQSRLAVRFIEHALRLTEFHGGKVAMLLKVGFDSADGRRHLFDEHPAFAVEYRLTRRIRWTNVPQKENGPTENHSFFVWDWRKRRGPAEKAYLPLRSEPTLDLDHGVDVTHLVGRKAP